MIFTVIKETDKVKIRLINKIGKAKIMDSMEQKSKEWQQTLEAMESAAQGKVVAAKEVYEWLNSWGTDNELEAPTSVFHKSKKISTDLVN